MAAPFLLVQLSDPHIGADWAGHDPVERLAAVVRAVGKLEPRPAAVIVSGDLVESAADAEYEQVRALLEPLGLPLHLLAGNHDDRAALRRHFDVPGAGGEPVQYAVELGPLRLVVLDSTCPGEEGGRLDGERLAWLDAALDDAAGLPTMIAMHHPPIVTGVPAMDAIGLAAHDRRALAAVVARHPQVRRIVAGHVHRPVATDLGGCAVLAAPSTYVQLRLDFQAPELSLSGEPPGFAIHAVLDGEVTSHVRYVRP
jgi:3',5'-cyclic-AMP phosphodiesterase